MIEAYKITHKDPYVKRELLRLPKVQKCCSQGCLQSHNLALLCVHITIQSLIACKYTTFFLRDLCPLQATGCLCSFIALFSHSWSVFGPTHYLLHDIQPYFCR